ncbi:hypothetical protein CN496_21230 [Bacillus cereus]|nr:hypothetical protein CN496_21230 [Bacillus cereus]
MMINKAYKFRTYPNQAQSILINKMTGCSRFVFDHFLSLWYMFCHEERIYLAKRSG